MRLKPMRLLAWWRRMVGPVSSIVCLIAWFVGGAVAIKAVVEGLWEYPRLSQVLGYIVISIVGGGGLIWFWQILAQIEFWRCGYRVIAISPKEYLRWKPGPKQWAYEERALDGRVLRLPFVRVILGKGYPAPSELRLPSEKAWDAQVPLWARGRRVEVLQRIVECVGGWNYARIADSE